MDEYDKPLVKNLNKDNFEAYREKLAALYSNFKTCADDIKLVFMTGVSRFSKLSVFSELNNLSDITFDDEFADICGITEKKLQDYFQVGITALALEDEVSYDHACASLKKNYDGYRFAKMATTFIILGLYLIALAKEPYPIIGMKPVSRPFLWKLWAD